MEVSRKRFLTAKKYRKTHGKKIFTCSETDCFDDIKYGLQSSSQNVIFRMIFKVLEFKAIFVL